ncbi:MAG: FAD-dependent oxidoreductase, partial [Gemmatimonadetes bacterium]|nr:FAD-dependent oxidoreductase [Gemmatimonadota bacterium]
MAPDTHVSVPDDADGRSSVRSRSMIRDVVVVGGGPAGAATATHLARAGLDVCVLDRARFPRDKACGEFLSPAATPLLEDLGVRDAIDAAGAKRLDQVRIFGGDQRLDLAFPA